jgi:hypothetical protein
MIGKIIAYFASSLILILFAYWVLVQGLVGAAIIYGLLM